MLQIKNVSKKYKTGELIQVALNDVSLNLRDNEFVSILGPSGSGKTTLLNIIGGLDRYDTGDLIINGISTSKYKDRDWDSYRNHTIGFVFQSYNLIPHQSVLANVELALTIAGISRSERKRRAKEVLTRVGLGDQLHKRPNQMSGGQMQRVAIARALINDPDILLADEPTGALDTETSVQIMELLKEVAKDRLVVMVTHNPELAQEYSTRIVKLRDGRITDDSMPFDPDSETVPEAVHKNMGKARMTFFTSLALSANNLRTKKGRTILTSFAGSIGIIGIALILSLSSGVNKYIADIQKDTMSSYPLSINAETMDLTSLIGLSNEAFANRTSDTEDDDEDAADKVYASYIKLETDEALTSSIVKNNLAEFKKYLDDESSEIRQFIGENGIIYTYDVAFSVYAYDPEEELINTDSDPDDLGDSKNSSPFGDFFSASSYGMFNQGGAAADNFEELMAGASGNLISQVVYDSYELINGEWPDAYDEVVIVLNRSGKLSVEDMYQLGYITGDEYLEIAETIANGEDAEVISKTYDEIMDKEFSLIPACDFYTENEDGTFTKVETVNEIKEIADDSLTLKVVGIIKPVDGSDTATLISPVAYTTLLTDYIITHTDESAVVKAQEADENTNVLNGMAFEAPTDEEKIEDTKEYISQMGVSDKASLYQFIMFYTMSEGASGSADQEGDPDTEEKNAFDMTGAGGMGGFMMDESMQAAALDKWLTDEPDKDILLGLYEQYIAGNTYEENLEEFGKVSYDTPSSISIYVDTFEDKDEVARCIGDYNKSVEDENKITYTDYVALLTSSITTIINAISYVLIAFVSISLVVSCIMIGIITHISVMERTKEIGILRALGASKNNISQVFNAETVIIGLISGLIGVGVSVLLTIPINMIIYALVGDADLKAQLPAISGVILVLISVIITVIGGLIPAKKAAKKDPVIALRTE